MLNEANAVYTHQGLLALICGIFSRRGIPYATELQLPNGRIADFVYFAAHGTIHIVEVKVDFRPGHLTEARYFYGDFCHYLWIAVPSNYRVPDVTLEASIRFSSPDDKIGIVSAGPQGMASYRPAQQRALPQTVADLTRALIRSRLTTGEQLPGLLAGPAAERPKNNNPRHGDGGCVV